MDDAKQAQIYYQQGLECLAGNQHHHLEIEASQHNTEKPALKIVQSDNV